MVTMQHIATHLGLSKASVSLALRGRPGVSDEVRARIRKAAARLGYRQHPLLGIHMAHVRNSRGPRYQATIAWIDNFPTKTGLKDIPIFREYFEGAREQARNQGFKLDEFWLNAPGMTPAKLSRILRARNITGLLLGPQPHSETRIDFDWEHFSVASLDTSLAAPRLHLVNNHHVRTMRGCLAHLRSFGYSRIGAVINRENDRRVLQTWSSTFWGDYHEQPLGKRVEPLFFHETDLPLTPDMVASWVRRRQPDAIIGADYVGAIHEGLARLGLKPGRDIALALSGSAKNDPFHAGMHQNERTIGAVAVDFLVGMLHRNEYGVPAIPQSLLVGSTWKSGQSVDERGPRKTQRPIAPATPAR